MWIGLQFADREDMKALIDRRVDQMVKAGLLEEVRQLLSAGLPRNATALQAIGYKELFPYFRGEASLAEAVESIKRESRRYAKRQITWFAREENAVPLYLDELDGPEDLLEAAVRILEEKGFGSPARKEEGL